MKAKDYAKRYDYDFQKIQNWDSGVAIIKELNSKWNAICWIHLNTTNKK